MTHLAKIEWLKLKNYKTFWVLIGLFTILLFGGNLVEKKMITTIGNATGLVKNAYAFPDVWINSAYCLSWFVLFLSLFMILNVCNEFNYKTGRQHIIDGLTRTDFLHGKIFVVLGLSIFATIIFILFAIILGYMGGGGNPFSNLEYILYVFIHIVNYLLFATTLALFIRRAGLTIVVFMAYPIIESILGYQINDTFNTQVGNFLMLQSSDELLTLPTFKMAAKMINVGNQPLQSYIYVVATLIWITIYYFLARRKMLTSDL